MPVVLRRVLVVLAVAGAGLVPLPATAAGYCTSGSGVSVVVDFGALGGGIEKGCDDSGNRNAAKAFTNTGHPLTYAQRQPGFVCRVDGVPQSDPCVNTSPSDAYWGLYWSDGTSGWKYSSLGVGSLDVPAGATVAFSWQNGGTADPPGVAPAAPAATATQTPTASTAPTRRPSPTTKTSAKPAPKPVASAGTTAPGVLPPSPRTAVTPAVTSAPSPTAPATSAAAVPSPAPSASPSATAAGPAAVSEPSDTQVATTSADGGGGLPWWVPVLVLLLLAGGTGGAWWRRRRGAS